MLYSSLAREEREVGNLVMNRKFTPRYCKANAQLNLFCRAFLYFTMFCNLSRGQETLTNFPVRALCLSSHLVD